MKKQKTKDRLTEVERDLAFTLSRMVLIDMELEAIKKHLGIKTVYHHKKTTPSHCTIKKVKKGYLRSEK